MEDLIRQRASKTRLRFNEEAREELLAGIDLFVRAIRITLGPKGRNVCRPGLNKGWAPWITHSAKALWEDMELPNRFQNMGLQLLKDAVKKVADKMGDGTTTTTILAHQMIREGHRLIAAGANAMLLKRGMEIAVAAAVEEIVGLARPLASYEELHRVIRTSVVDEEVAQAMAEAAEKIGGAGLLHVWRGYTPKKVDVRYTNGMKFRRGYVSPYFDLTETKVGVTLENPKVLVVDDDIKGAGDLIPILGKMNQAGLKSLYVVAKDYQGDSIALLVKNSIAEVIKCVASRSPAYGEHQSEMLDDIAVFTGGVAAGQGLSLPLAYVGVSDLGEAETVISTAEDTTIIGGKGDPEVLKARIKNLQQAKAKGMSDVEHRRLEERIAGLASATAIVSIGGETETDRNELLDRAESAVSAMAAADDEGVVPGGGVAYLLASDALSELRAQYQGDIALGIDLVRRALEEPMRQIAENAGESGSSVVARVRRLRRELDHEYLGYDAMTGEFCDLMEAGVIDPAKLDRLALQYAASAATMILTCNAAIIQTNPI